MPILEDNSKEQQQIDIIVTYLPTLKETYSVAEVNLNTRKETKIYTGVLKLDKNTIQLHKTNYNRTVIVFLNADVKVNYIKLNNTLICAKDQPDGLARGTGTNDITMKETKAKDEVLNNPEFEFVFDGECGPKRDKNGSLLEHIMFYGNGDNEGSSKKREERCYKSCKKAQKINRNIKGFVVNNNGRCFCEENDTDSCERTNDGTYKRYNF